MAAAQRKRYRKLLPKKEFNVHLNLPVLKFENKKVSYLETKNKKSLSKCWESKSSAHYCLTCLAN